MLHENLLQYRKILRLSQEETAEKVGVSRQAYAKWEAGDTVPELKYCQALAALFGITLDDLVSKRNLRLDGPPGKHVLGIVVTDENGTLTLPRTAIHLFDIRPGDRYLLLGDEKQGMALVPYDTYEQFARAVLTAGGKEKED